MKQIIKIAHLVIFILLCEVSYAQTKQTQQAVVKTPERRNVNGQITPAKYWDNATVTVMTAGESSKQSYVSGKGGKVGFPAPKPFYVVGVSANK